MEWLTKFALVSIGAILAVKVFEANAEPRDFTPEELQGMLACVREGRHYAFENIYRYCRPKATGVEISGALTQFQIYLQNNT